MKRIPSVLPALCLMLALLLCGCREKQQAGVAAKPEAVAPVRTADDPAPPDEIGESTRALMRLNAIEDLIEAHQKVSVYEGFAERYEDIIREMTHPGEIAVTQNDLSEIQKDIREEENRIPDLEKAVEDLSKPGDASYRLEIMRYTADLAEAKAAATMAELDRTDESGRLKEMVGKMHKATAQEVLDGTYPKMK